MLQEQATPEDARVTPVEGLRTYFPHVEGLRGIAALYVFLYHIWQTGISHAGATLGVLLPVTLPWLQFGHFAVAVFIVISGYCLGLPVAQRLHAPFDAVRFAKRRARRLGPAYALALLLSVIPFFAVAALRGQHIPPWHVGVAIAAHLALVHNLIPALAEYLNGPMWSIALEAQIYVVFALVLIPVWKHFGPLAQLAVALALGLAPHFVFGGRFDYTICWLLALFAMGVVAAQVTVQQRDVSRILRAAAFASASVAAVAVLPAGDAAPDGALWPADLLVGLAVALLFVTSGGARPSWTSRLLSLRPIVTLGTFSYSLYLVHGPLVLLVGAALERYHVGTAGSALAYGLLVPAVIAIAYGFYRVAERPFLSPAFRSALDQPTTPGAAYIGTPGVGWTPGVGVSSSRAKRAKAAAR